MWNCHGEKLHKENVHNLGVPLWRPRVNMIKPKTFDQNFLKNQKAIVKRYDESDDKIINSAKWEAEKVRVAKGE